MSDIGIRNHPVGSVCLWNGLIANIPTGWFLMDGTNGTSDLTSKFIRGAESGQDAGGTGGSDTHAIVEAEQAEHNHGTTDATHNHKIGGGGVESSAAGTTAGDFPNVGISANSATTTITVGNIGSGTAHENRPQFYQIAYIQRKT